MDGTLTQMCHNFGSLCHIFLQHLLWLETRNIFHEVWMGHWLGDIFSQMTSKFILICSFCTFADSDKIGGVNFLTPLRLPWMINAQVSLFFFHYFCQCFEFLLYWHFPAIFLRVLENYHDKNQESIPTVFAIEKQAIVNIWGFQPNVPKHVLISRHAPIPAWSRVINNINCFIC